MRLTDEQIKATIEYAKTKPTGLQAADADRLCRLALQNHAPSRFVVYAMWRQMQKETVRPMSAYRKPDRCAWCCARLTPANAAVVGDELVCADCAEGYTLLRPEDRERDVAAAARGIA